MGLWRVPRALYLLRACFLLLSDLQKDIPGRAISCLETGYMCNVVSSFFEGGTEAFYLSYSMCMCTFKRELK